MMSKHMKATNIADSEQVYKTKNKKRGIAQPGIRTQNLLLRRQTPYPLGQKSDTIFPQFMTD